MTTAAEVSAWTANTLEQHRIQARVLDLGIQVVASHNLVRVGEGEIELACGYPGRGRVLAAASVVMVTSRRPDNGLTLALATDGARLEAAAIKSLQAIGACDTPSTIAAAVHDGHRAAREFDAPPVEPDMPYRRERVALDTSV